MNSFIRQMNAAGTASIKSQVAAQNAATKTTIANEKSMAAAQLRRQKMVERWERDRQGWAARHHAQVIRNSNIEIGKELEKLAIIRKQAEQGRLSRSAIFGGANPIGVRHSRVGDVAKSQLPDLVGHGVLTSLHGNFKPQDVTGQMRSQFDMASTLTRNAARGTLAYNAAIEQNIMLQRAWSRRMIDTGKNIQWQGRQLTVGLSVPLLFAGAALGKQALDIDEQLTRILKVYSENTDGLAERSREFAKEIGQSFGVQQSQTLDTVATFAQQGRTGEDLFTMASESLRIARLGDIDQAIASELVRTTQTVFQLNFDELTTTLNRFNKVENDTALSLAELAEGFPIVAQVAAQVGMSAEETAASLAIMREAGVDVNTGATALRNSLMRLVDPTDEAHQSFKAMGVDLDTIFARNGNNAMEVLKELAGILDDSQLTNPELLDVFGDLFGVRQTGRVLALAKGISEIGTASSASARAFKAVGASAEEVAAGAEEELRIFMESNKGRFEQLKSTLTEIAIDLGNAILPTLLSIMDVTAKIAGGFMSAGQYIHDILESMGPFGAIIEKFGKFALIGGILAGPIIQFIGLIRNFIGSLSTGMLAVKEKILGVKGATDQLAMSVHGLTQTEATGLTVMRNFSSTIGEVGAKGAMTSQQLAGLNAKSMEFVTQSGLVAVSAERLNSINVRAGTIWERLKNKVDAYILKLRETREAQAQQRMSVGKVVSAVASLAFTVALAGDAWSSFREEGLWSSRTIMSSVFAITSLTAAFGALNASIKAVLITLAMNPIVWVAAAVAAGSLYLASKRTKDEMTTSSELGEKIADDMGLAAREVAKIADGYEDIVKKQEDLSSIKGVDINNVAALLSQFEDPSKAFANIANTILARGGTAESIMILSRELNKLGLEIKGFNSEESLKRSLQTATEFAQDQVDIVRNMIDDINNEIDRLGRNSGIALAYETDIGPMVSSLKDGLERAVADGDLDAARVVMTQIINSSALINPMLRSKYEKAVMNMFTDLEHKAILPFNEATATSTDFLTRIMGMLAALEGTMPKIDVSGLEIPDEITQSVDNYASALDDLVKDKSIFSDFAGAFKSAVGDAFDPALDAVDAEFEARADAISEKYDQMADAAQDAYDAELDAVNDRYDAELEALEKVYDQNQEISRQKDREARREKIRRQLSDDMAQSAIDFDVAVASGDLGQANTILQNRLVSQRKALDDLAALEEEARDDANKKQFEIQKGLLDDKYDLEKEALKDKLDLQKEELKAAEDHAKKLNKITEDRVKEDIKKIAETAVAYPEQLEENVRKVNDILGSAGMAGDFATSWEDVVLRARDEVANEARWRAAGTAMVENLGKGVLESFDQFMALVNDIARGNMTVEEAVEDWNKSHNNQYEHGVDPRTNLPSGVTRDGRAPKRHSGGFIGQTRRTPGLRSDEVPSILQTGEYVIQRDAVKKVGVSALENINKYHDGGIVGAGRDILLSAAFGAMAGRLPSMGGGAGVLPIGSIMNALDLLPPDGDRTRRGRYGSWKYGLAPGVANIVASGLASLPGAQYVISAFRDAEHNRSVGGAQYSDHMYGRGIDIVGTKGKNFNELMGISNFFKSRYGSSLRWVGDPVTDPRGHDDHVHLSFKKNLPQYRWGGEVMHDNTVANLHKGEIVLKKPIANALERNIMGMGSVGNSYSFHFENVGSVKDADTIANIVIKRIEKRDSRKSSSRRVG